MGMIYTPLNLSSSPSSGLANQFLNSPATFYTRDSSRNSLVGSSMLSHTDVLPSQANVFVTVDGTVSIHVPEVFSSSRHIYECSQQKDV